MAVDLSGAHLCNYGSLVTYNGVTLAFTSMQIRNTAVYNGARHLYTTYRISLAGIETRDNIPDARYGFNELKKRLSVRGLELTKQDRSGAGYVTTLRLVPGTLSNARLYSGNTPNDTNRGVLVDVMNGPNPLYFEIDRFFGDSFRYTWVLDVTTFGTDLSAGFAANDPNNTKGICGLLASVIYGVDADHLVTRRVTGTFYVGPRGAFLPPGGTADLATRDADAAARKLIASNSLEADRTNMLASLVYLPNGFQRVGQTWQYDDSLTQIRFELVDVERYRTPPRNMTNCEAKYKVSYNGVSFGAPLRTALTGVMVSAKDISQDETMVRILELGNIMMGSADPFGRYVDTFEYEVDLYHNAIAFSMTGWINFGSLIGTRNADTILKALGLGSVLAGELDSLSDNGQSYRPTLWGTGALVGSAYATTILTGSEVDVRPDRLTSVFSRPAYTVDGQTIYGATTNTFGVDGYTVMLDPGQVKVILNRNEVQVVNRDQGANGVPYGPVVIRNQSALGICFVGATAWVRQEDATQELLPEATINTLKAYGTFRIERTIKTKVHSAASVATPNPNAKDVYRTFKIWVFYLNPDKYGSYFKRYGSDLNEVEFRVNQDLEKAGPGLQGFLTWVQANFQ